MKLGYSAVHTPAVDSAIGECEEPLTPGQAKLDCYLGVVQRIEEEIAPIESFNDRRDYLRYFREHECPLDEEEWQSVYAMLLYRNPSEIPHRHEYEKCRRNTESTVYYSGTVKKEGRNFRYPGELCFSVQSRQKQLFGDWCWPTEGAATEDYPFDIGPRDEQVHIVAQPPRRETWESLAEMQKAAVQRQWVEQRAPVMPHYNNPVPTIWQDVCTAKQELRPAALKAKVVGVVDRYKWEWNPVEIVRWNWPSVFGLAKSVKGKLTTRTMSAT